MPQTCDSTGGFLLNLPRRTEPSLRCMLFSCALLPKDTPPSCAPCIPKTAWEFCTPHWLLLCECSAFSCLCGQLPEFLLIFCWILWASEKNNLQWTLSALTYKGVVAQLQNFVPISPPPWLYKWPQKAACSVRTLTECSQSALSLDHNRLNE